MIEKCVLLYAAITLGTAILLGVLNVTQLEVLYSVFVIEFLVLLELLTSFKRSLARRMNVVAFGLFLGFIYIVIMRVIEILR
jgi:Ca2+/Na+ antiporter